ncbi:hypothetical protein ABZ468_07680 [Streptomyces sp. NPDC005708]|uniref:hypothetical protein n=1 Tax=Streptomyces sp. NPDC005708 TaxID=3154564 RepID=UPI0033CC08EB
MLAALAVKPLEELTAQYGPMRSVLHHTDATDIPAAQVNVFMLSILGGKTLRESVILGADGTADLFVRLVEYIDPVTGTVRYAVDYWSLEGYWATDHTHRAVAETAYEGAVRAEFVNPTIPLCPERFARGGLTGFYDETDVLF